MIVRSGVLDDHDSPEDIQTEYYSQTESEPTPEPKKGTSPTDLADKLKEKPVKEVAGTVEDEQAPREEKQKIGADPKRAGKMVTTEEKKPAEKPEKQPSKNLEIF